MTFEIDRPANPEGEWWIDLELGGAAAAVAWRPDEGFGIHTGEAVYGARPDEIFKTPRQAAIRLLQLASRGKTGAARGIGLRELRLILEMQQAKVAEAIGVDQTSVSRMESRRDHKLSTIHDYVKALGGRLELRVRFDSFEGPIHVDHDP